MLEDLPDHRRVIKARDHPDLATAYLAGLDLDAEHPNTPWYRVRCARGFGTRAARRAMKSSGSNTTWLVPSRYGVFSV